MIYGLSSQVILRMTGFPVEHIRSLNRPALASDAEALLRTQAAAHAAQRALLDRLRELGPETRKLRKDVERGRPLVGSADAALTGHIGAYNEAQSAYALASEAFVARYAQEHEEARRTLYALAADDRFRTVVLFSSTQLEALIPPPGSPLPKRNSTWRQREVTWLSYLQRLTTKNETISFYGPSVWGRVDPEVPAVADIVLDDREIDARTLYLERWTCMALAAKISEDPEVFSFLQPAWRGGLAVSETSARLLSEDRALELTGHELSILRRCDGRRTAAEIGDEAALRKLESLGAIWLAVRIPVTVTPFEHLQRTVAAWPAGAPRDRWTARLDRFEQLRAKLAQATGDLPRQRESLTQLLQELSELGIGKRESQAMYTARLPVNEDCRRAATRVTLGQPFVEQATRDLEPWYEMWRDLAGLYATRIFALLRPVWQSLGGEPVPLATFLRACDRARIPLQQKGGEGLARELYDEIQRTWAAQLGDRASRPEVDLTPEDLSVFRRTFPLRRMKGWDRPAPDFQIAASDPAALRDGRWTLVLAEIHPDTSPWQHCFFGWCPDPQRFVQEYCAPGSTHGPVIDFLNYHDLLQLHTLLWLYWTVPGWTIADDTFVDGMSSVRPADAVVELTEDDLIVRHPDGRVLGSLVHTAEVAFNTHQLQLIGTGEHVPRLRVGRVVVQRRRWKISPDDALREQLARRDSDAFLALQRLRHERGLPHEVFLQPVLPVRQTKHKAGKPFFVDFRNPLLVEMMATHLRDYRELVVTEMLPTNDQCWLADRRGHYSCEFRLIAQPATDREVLVDNGFAV